MVAALSLISFQQHSHVISFLMVFIYFYVFRRGFRRKNYQSQQRRCCNIKLMIGLGENPAGT